MCIGRLASASILRRRLLSRRSDQRQSPQVAAPGLVWTPILFAPVGGFEHGVGLAYPGHIVEENLELAVRLFGFFGLDAGESLVGVTHFFGLFGVHRPVRYERPAPAGDYDHALHSDHADVPSFLEQYLPKPEPRLGGPPHEVKRSDG